MKGLVSNLIQTKWITPKNGDEINSEYKGYIENVAVGSRENFLKFSKLKDRLDEFISPQLEVWMNILNYVK